QQVAPGKVEIEILDLHHIPMYNQEIEEPIPESVKHMKHKIEKADAILFACPEYNYSIPAVLKNVIDWGSRPYGTNSWKGKKGAIMSAAMSLCGGARAQHHLRQILVAVGIDTFSQPELMIGSAHEKFDHEGKCLDPKVVDKVKEMLIKLVDFAS
ncbi:MAG: NAD(P)H-dependent oxidoreductase, partial [Chlamydiae bacterium]|nr:NAD(P)H-dependent oxidoreductase [Chlamydiota bacterium]